LANFNQTQAWYKSSLGKGNSKVYRSSLKGRYSQKRKNRVGSFKTFPRSTKAEKLRSTQKNPDIGQIQVCTNHGPRGSYGATMGKTIFTCVYIGKKSLKILFWEVVGQISIILDAKHPSIK
jgi:hypothetical protein